MLQSIKNIYNLGVKELIELSRDKLMVVLIIYAFTLGIYTAAKGEPDSVQKAPIAIVDEDGTQLSKRISDAFLPPMFILPQQISRSEIDRKMDDGTYTFVLVIPSGYEKDVMGGREPELQLNVDATRMTQAFVGSGYIETIINQEIQAYKKDNGGDDEPCRLVLRNRFNANLTPAWNSAIAELVNNVTLLAIILTGSALIRERENTTLEHLLVMPVNSFEIMVAKVWSMMLVVWVASAGSLYFIIRQVLAVPIEGSLLLFLVGVALHLFAATCLGIFLACVAQNMPQMGMLLILVLMPMNMLSGSSTPAESMPLWVQRVMLLAPTTHFVKFSQQILFRGAGFNVVWVSFTWLAGIGVALFMYSLSKFKKTAS